MNITTLNSRGRAALSELSEVILSLPYANPSYLNRVQVKTGSRVLLDNYYYCDFENRIRLDLRDLVLDNTRMTVPGLYAQSLATDENSMREESEAVLPLTIIVTARGETDTYSFTAYPFDYFPKYTRGYGLMPSIDEMRVPEDYLLPLSLFLEEDAEHNITISLYQEGSGESEDYSYTPDASMAIMVSQLVPIMGGSLEELFTIRPDKPFKIKIAYEAIFSGSRISSAIWTPSLQIVKEDMEQYAFLSPEGIYYNIPMSGKLWYKPEYEMNNLELTNMYECASASLSDLHEQNSGPLTFKTAMALAGYLTSRSIYHYDRARDLFRPIVIESPSVNISAGAGVYSLTFQWRYADNGNINQ